MQISYVSLFLLSATLPHWQRSKINQSLPFIHWPSPSEYQPIDFISYRLSRWPYYFQCFLNSMVYAYRIYKSLGCPNGCSDGYRGGDADDLRAQALSCLQRLMNLDATQFRFYVKRTLLGQPLQAVMDQLHALLGFCKDPAMSSNQPGVHGGLFELLPF